jgi:hypothetical protein
MDRSLSETLVPTFTDRGCRVVSPADPPTAVISVFRSETLIFILSSSSIVLTRLSGPRSRPTTSQKIWWRRESNPDLWICSQELWPLDQRDNRLCVICRPRHSSPCPQICLFPTLRRYFWDSSCAVVKMKAEILWAQVTGMRGKAKKQALRQNLNRKSGSDKNV